MHASFREEALPYQPRESPFNNPSRRQIYSDEDDVEGDIGEENSHSFEATGVRFPIRTPLQSTTLHNQPLTGLHTNGLLAMLQQQQELLQKLVKDQEEMKSQQTLLNKKVAKLEENFNRLAPLAHLQHQES